MRRVVIALLLLVPALSVRAQFVSVPANARSAAMGGCLLGLDADRYLSVGYRNGFAVAGMGTSSLLAATPLGKQGHLALGYSHFGDADYAEHRVGTAYALRVAERMTVGVAASYNLLAVGDGHYENQQWLGASALVGYDFSPRLRLSLLAGSRPWDSARPWRMHAAVTYRSTNRLLTVVEVESEDRWRLRLGAEYCYRRHFFFRAGVATEPLVITAGIGVFYGRYEIDISAESHPVLGISPQISLAVCF